MKMVHVVSLYVFAVLLLSVLLFIGLELLALIGGLEGIESKLWYLIEAVQSIRHI